NLAQSLAAGAPPPNIWTAEALPCRLSLMRATSALGSSHAMPPPSQTSFVSAVDSSVASFVASKATVVPPPVPQLPHRSVSWLPLEPVLRHESAGSVGVPGAGQV